MLAVHYLDDPKLKELMAKEYYTIDEVNKYIQFPRNLNEKWENLNPGNFTLAEAIYVFIEEVIIPIKSKLLEKTGTAIIDAPGLFVSIYDDKLAKNAMLDASAIFYLFTGEKQISQEDEKALTLIRDSGYDKKLFFGINFKKNPELIKEDDGIGKSIEASLRQLGFHNKQHQNILYFNAFLAMRAAQGKALLEGTLDEYTRQCIINDARKSQLPASTVEEAWLESTCEVMTIIRGKGWKELQSLGFCREAVNIVYEASNWYPTIDKINDYVFTHKAYALLVSQGCQPIINILSMTEQDLLSDEKEAEQEYEDRLQQYSEASAHLEQFIEESKSLKDYYISDLWDTILAGDYYDNVLIPAVKRVALISAPQIDKEVGVLSTIADTGKKFFAKVKHFLTDKESNFTYIENKCTKILSTYFDNEIDTCSRKWMEGLSNNSVYNGNVKNDILQLMDRTKDKWKQFKMDNDIFNRLSQLLPEMSGEIKKDMQSPRISLDALGQIKNVKLLNAFADFGMAFGSFIALGYVYVFLMPLDFIIPGAGIILSALAMGLVKGFQAITGQKEKRISALADNIEDHLLKEMSKSSQEIKQNLINGKGSTPGLNFIRKYYSLAYDAQLQEMHNKLTDDKNNSLRLYELSSKEREKVAREAKEFREEKINPLQEKVIEFKEEVVKLWPECD
jgi:hypothetical protein